MEDNDKLSLELEKVKIDLNTIFVILRQNAHFETTTLLLWIKIQG